MSSFLSWYFQTSSPLAIPVLGGSKFILGKYSLKSVINTQSNVVQVLCWCQKGRFCLHLLLHSQRQQSYCLPASFLVLTWLKTQPVTSWIKSLDSLRHFHVCLSASKQKRWKDPIGWYENEGVCFGRCVSLNWLASVVKSHLNSIL